MTGEKSRYEAQIVLSLRSGAAEEGSTDEREAKDPVQSDEHAEEHHEDN
jgi:hypothetical protein